MDVQRRTAAASEGDADAAARLRTELERRGWPSNHSTRERLQHAAALEGVQLF